MKKLILAFGLLSLSAGAFADMLVCNSLNTKTVLRSVSVSPNESYVLVSSWSREYERARVPDLYENGVEGRSVQELISKGSISDRMMNASIRIDFRQNLVKVTNRGETIQEQISCKYYK